MKILAVGDIVGENGLEKLKEILPKIKEEEQIDFVIVNSENVAGGMGITFKTFNQLLKFFCTCSNSTSSVSSNTFLGHHVTKKLLSKLVQAP